jgi:hypothetical protein
MSTKKAKRPSTVIMTMRVTPEYRQWLDELAEHCRLDRSKAIDKGLILLAKQEGFEKKAPPR